MISRENYGGMPARILGFLTNHHTSRSAFLVPRHRAAVFRVLARHWKRQSRHWDVLRLLHLPRRSGQMDTLIAALRDEGLLVFGPDQSNRLFYASADTSYEGYLAAQDRGFRRNLSHARNALARAGDVTVDVLTGVDALDAGMHVLFELDVHSHKQGVEHAIYTQNEKNFCVSLCRELAHTRDAGFELSLLKVGGRPICGLLSLVFRTKSFLLVTYYDERVRHLQPGRNLFAAAVQRFCQNDRVSEIDFNGNSPFVQSWTSGSDVFEAVSACHRRPYSLMIAASKTVKRVTTPFRADLRARVARWRARSAGGAA